MRLLSDDLTRLGAIFAPQAKLFVVGGFVRDHLLGVRSTDIDICSELDVYAVKKLLLNTDFEVLDKNLRLGTLFIKTKCETYEYTAFRSDSYACRGEHSPVGVASTTDILVDATRRDFLVNAIYFDIIASKIVDPLGALADIDDCTISTTRQPKDVFSEDGLRLLRLARFAGYTGFKVDSDTLIGARDNAHMVSAIAPERIAGEIKKILDLEETELGQKQKLPHVSAMRLLKDIGVLGCIFDSCNSDTSFDFLCASNDKNRWCALMLDLYFGCGDDFVSRACDALVRLKLSKRETSAIVSGLTLFCHAQRLMSNTDDRASDELLWLVANNFDQAKSIVGLIEVYDSEAGACVEDCLDKIVAEKLPKSISELPVSGVDLIDLIEESNRAIVLAKLHRASLTDRGLAKRENALRFVSELACDDQF